MKIKILSLCFLGFLMQACSSSYLNTKYDYDSSVDYTQIKTYAFGEIDMDPEKISDFDRARVIKAVERGMKGKGMVQDTANPDVVLALYVNLSSYKKQTASVGVGVGVGGYGHYGGMGVGVGGSKPIYESVDEGTLVVDIIKTDGMQLIWRGEGQKSIDQKVRSFEEMDKRLQYAVDKVLEHFPPDESKKKKG